MEGGGRVGGGGGVVGQDLNFLFVRISVRAHECLLACCVLRDTEG